MVDSAGRNTFGEAQTGIEPGTQLRTNTTGLPKARLKELGVIKPVTITPEGAGLILRLMKDTGKTAQGAFVDLQKSVKAARISASDAVARRDMDTVVRRYFPDGLEGIEKSLNEAKVYEQALFDAGFLEDGDPDLKDLDKEFKELPKTQQNRKSRSGRRIKGIQESRGLPTIVGRDSKGELVFDKDNIRPYKYRISNAGLEALKEVELPSFASQPLTKELELKGRRQAAKRPNLSTMQETLSQEALPKSGEPPAIRGGEPVEPHGGASSRRASGAVISRRDANTFKEAMGKAMEAPPKGKTNLFKRIVEEARKIDPRVSVGDMQNIKDYLYFRGVLEADSTISDKVGPSRISDVDVPEYVKPSAKYYKDGLAILDAGGSNEPLVIGKLSADANPPVEPVKRETLDDRISRGDKPEIEPSKTPSRLLDIIKRGGRGAAKAFIPGIGLGLTVIDEAFAAKETARSSPSEIEYDEMMERAKREELIPEESELRGRTMEEVKSRTSFMNQ